VNVALKKFHRMSVGGKHQVSTNFSWLRRAELWLNSSWPEIPDLDFFGVGSLGH
jgi:hypothetical protein